MIKITIDIHDAKFKDLDDAIKKATKYDPVYRKEDGTHGFTRMWAYSYLVNIVNIDKHIAALILFGKDINIDYTGKIFKELCQFKITEEKNGLEHEKNN